jgi:hypothetical protein
VPPYELCPSKYFSSRLFQISNNRVTQIKFLIFKGTAGWRILYDELREHFFPPNIIRAIKWRLFVWVGNGRRQGGNRNAYRVLVGKFEEWKLIGKCKCRWYDNVKRGHKK